MDILDVIAIEDLVHIVQTQDFGLWSIMECTFICSRPRGGWDDTKWFSFVFNHSWFQIFILLPFSTLHLVPFFYHNLWSVDVTANKFWIMLRGISKKSSKGKYLTLNTLETITSWLEMNFHPCFPSIDKLKYEDFWIPYHQNVFFHSPAK